MSFPINTTIPAASHYPGNDQPGMQQNFLNINGFLGVDHVSPGATNDGYHKVIHQPPQGSDPGSIAGIGQLYTKTLSSDQQLFFESGLGVITQLTGPSAPSTGNNGFVYLPGGILFQWGTRVNNTGGLKTITLPTPFPNNFYNAQATMVRQSNNVDAIYCATAPIAGMTSTIQFYDTSTGNQFYWFAIGN